MGEHDPRRHDEDTRAILDRRRFLIKSTLVGAGLGAAAAGCDLLGPRACLAPPQPCLSVAPPPQPCLSPPPRPCLSIRREP
ncbi:MAG TPA: hypothetical protein VNE39_12760 [Planctomycetota bacterium]|nr:hypothetical protein [Planctomycetota bacterium]